MTGPADQQYAFCGHRLDGRRRELTGPDGAAIALTSKAFDVLLKLIERREQVMGKDELLAAVWPRRVVEENNLTQAVSALRKALGGDARDHRYIITVPGRGYRFVADVCAGDEACFAEPTIPRSAPTPMTVRSAPAAVVRAAGVPTSGRQVGHRAIAVGALLFTRALFAAGAWRLRAAPPTRAPQQAALAVLPFRSLSPGPRDEALELGMAETLIAQLSRSGALRVRSLAASQRLDGHRDPVDAGRRLATDYVVEGSTQRRGETIRVNARLLGVADGRTLWAGTFDTHRDRVFTLQDRIAVEIGAALALTANAVAVAPVHRSPCEGDSAEA